MSFIKNKILLLLAVVLAILSRSIINFLYEVPIKPQFEDAWWGAGNASKENKSVKRFEINVSDEILSDLKLRLEQTRPFTSPLEGVQQQYGMNTNLLNEIVLFWKTKYKWREREMYLNKYPQYITNIQGLNIHFIHIKPITYCLQVRIVPLLILHGWAGSIREFYDIVPLLIAPQEGKDFVFELVIPSLPGFGFSDAAVRPGLGPVQMAEIFKNLMGRLNLESYYLQGGDWGSSIISAMAMLYPDKVLGVHSNMCIVNTPLATIKLILGSLYPPLVIDKEFENKLYPLSNFYGDLLSELSYFTIQATKPDTLGIVLNDSPVGLAAYILEKFITFTNPQWKYREDGGLTSSFTYTQLLDNIMIYWVTGSITTSMRIYAESISKNQMDYYIQRIPIEVPSACAKFKNEIIYLPDWILKDRFVQLVQSTNIPLGGHFAAFEVPELLAADIWSAVEKFETINMKKYEIY